MTCPEDTIEQRGSCCKKCPKGTHVSKYCGKNVETECAPCQDGFYTENNNYMDSCLKCMTSCDLNGQKEMTPCTKESNRKCTCKEGYYCTDKGARSGDHCTKCGPVQQCRPGEGVSVQPNITHNTVCKPCPSGTFNNITDYRTPCSNHTRCSDQGRVVLSAGTATADATCGDHISACHWLLPASMWAGLILTLIFVIIGVKCLQCKRRRKAVITSASSEQYASPVLPPDVIKHPRSPQIETLSYDNKPWDERHEGSLECDGVSVDVHSEKRGVYPVPHACMPFLSDPFKSEPQEDDWP